MRSAKYTTDPKEIYTLELTKLQRCFFNIQTMGEGASEITRIQWRHVELLRQMNFILQEAVMVGDVLLKIDPLTK
jgi:hypothetical protein